MNKLYLCLVFAFLFLSSCKKSLFNFSEKKDKMEIIDPDFDYLSSKAKFKFNHDNKKVSATANFRLKKDSIIWASITPGLGLEVARVLINKDHIHILDKLNRQYYKYEYQELSEQFGFEVSYQLIQSVILGDLAIPYTNEKVEKAGDYFLYETKRGDYTFQNFIGAASQKLERVEVKDETSENTISVNYGEFIQVNEEIFPNEISAVVQYESTEKPNTEIDILYNKLIIENGPLVFPFSVPGKYGRK